MSPAIMKQVMFSVTLPITITKKDDTHISYCPPLDIYSQGDTREEAEKNIIEAVKLFIDTCFERGTLDAVLKECGFQPIHKPAKPTEPKTHTVTVPLSYKVTGDHIAACRN